jgi:opacity protein-like surface antigen
MVVVAIEWLYVRTQANPPQEHAIQLAQNGYFMARRSSVFLLASLFIFLLTTTLNSFGQSEDRFNFSGGGGFTTPRGRTSDDVNTGWNLGLRGGYNVSDHVGLDLDFSYDHWGLNSAALARYAEPGGTFSIWSFSFNPVVRLMPHHRIDPYITAGPGIYHRNLTLTTPTVVNTVVCDPFFGFCFPAAVGVNQVVASASAYKGGWNAGGGLDLRLGSGNWKVFAEARYTQMFTTHGENLGYVPATFGLRW